MCQRAYSSQTKQPIQLVAFCKNKSVFSASSISWYSKGLHGQKERKKSCNPRILLKHSFTLSNEDRELAQTNSMITKAYALFLRRLTGKDGLQGGLLAEQNLRPYYQRTISAEPWYNQTRIHTAFLRKKRDYEIRDSELRTSEGRHIYPLTECKP